LKLVGYCRVSTAGQVEDGQGLDIQEKAIRAWSREHSHRLVAVHRDEGVSGTTDDRDGLEEALSAVRFNGADGLVVHSLDRLARSLTVQEAALQQVWAAGGRVFAVDTGEVLADDPDDPVRTFVRQVLGAVSQLEAGMIARRLRRGRLHKAEQGGYAHGAPPYGWRAEGGELVADDDEQAVLERIRVMRVEGASLRDIAGVLNAEGVPSKRGGRWHPQTVARVLG
jgi:DNA invertase Pin-like site-specific DNA recombinase